MSGVAAPFRERGPLVDRVAEGTKRHLADPLFRNAYALMFNAGATGALGVVYWILAARNYEAADVGRSSAAIAAMMLLSGLTAVGLTGMVSRFLPRAGPATGAFVRRTYLASALVAGTTSIGFLLTLERWGPSYSRLNGAAAGLGFTIAVIAWAIFTLQDAVLPALRSAVWVPIENIAFGIAKIALVISLAAAAPRDGVFLSWVIPVALSIVPMNLLIFLRLAPRHVRATEDRHAPPTIRDVGRFLAGDYVGALFTLGVVYLVPVVVAAQVGPTTTAYFYVAWIIGGVIDLLAVNMAISLTVEGTLDLDRLGANTRAALRRIVQILLPIVTAAVVLAHAALGTFGANYARSAAPLLQLLAVSALPRALVELYVGALRAQSRTRQLALVQGLRCIMIVGLAVPFTVAFGITGTGWAVLVGQTLTAAVIAPGLLGVLGHRRRAGWHAVRAAPVGRVVVRWPIAALTLLAAAGLALFLVPLRTVDVEAINGYGLVSVLPLTTLLGVAVLTLCYVLTLALNRPHRWFLAAQLIALVVCLHGVTSFVENEPRFPTAWQHLGFLDYIGNTGDVAPTLDARFNWPGFFAAATFVARAVGISDPSVLLGPAPVVAELLYLLPFVALLACIRANWRTKWFAAFLLISANWVGQDYFSPQSLNFLVYLLVIAFVLTWFGASQPLLASGAVGRALRRVPAPNRLPWLRGTRVSASAEPTEPGELPPLPAATGRRLAVAALILGLFVVSTASHQISPFMIVVAVAALVVVGRCELTGLPLLLGVIMVSWLSFVATGYWAGHLDEIFGNIGSLGANVGSSVQGRATHADPQHTAVAYTRLLLAGGVFGLAALGALRRRRNGVRDRALLALAVVPLTAVAVQSYGGEVGLRVYLFALPALCILAASAFFGGRAGQRSWVGLAAAGSCAVLLVGGFLVARYGNERFERTTSGEVAALDYVYDRGASPARIMWLSPMPGVDQTPAMPWGARDMGRIGYFSRTAPDDPDDVSGIVGNLRNLGPDSYLIVNRAQAAYLQLTFSYAPDWGERLRANLDARPDLRRVFATRDAAVYTLASTVTDRPRPTPTHPGLSLATTPWTPPGIAVTVLLIAVLVAREALRIRLPAGARARLVPLTRAAYVLLVAWAAVVLERFASLS